MIRRLAALGGIAQRRFVELDDQTIHGGARLVEPGRCTKDCAAGRRRLRPEQAQSGRNASATSVPYYHETSRRATGRHSQLFHVAFLSEGIARHHTDRV
jgi:hypothetical protein